MVIGTDLNPNHQSTSTNQQRITHQPSTILNDLPDRTSTPRH
jgi:hypothetical protein